MMPHPTRIFTKPDQMLDAWNLYKEDIIKQENDWLKIQYVGKDGERKTDGMKVPYTLEGFERFCREKYGEVGQYFDNQEKNYDPFLAICRAIRKEIRENQIIGGMMGVFNPSITQRLNNLKEAQEIIVKEQMIFPRDDEGNK